MSLSMASQNAPPQGKLIHLKNKNKWKNNCPIDEILDLHFLGNPPSMQQFLQNFKPILFSDLQLKKKKRKSPFFSPLLFLFNLFLFGGGDSVTLCNSPGHPGTCCGEQSGLD